MRIIYTTSDAKDVALAELALRDAGIGFRIDNGNTFAASLQTPAVAVHFLVRDEDEARAKRAIDTALRRMGEKPPRRKAL